MSTAVKKRYSAAEFLALEAAAETKHEFYQGEIFAMAGASPAHNRLVLNLVGNLFEQLRGLPCQPFHSDTMVKVAATGLLTYPDVSIACPPIEREPAPIEVLLNPRVLIEVLSPSTELYDRNVKFRHYQQITSVEEIVLVRQNEAAVEHYRRQPDNVWGLTTITDLERELVLVSVDCRLSLAQIYQGVEFPPPEFEIKTSLS